MFDIIFIFGPALLCASYYIKIRNIPLKSLLFLQWYGIFLFIINGFVITVTFLRGWGDEKLHPFHNFKSTAKYWILSLVVALVLPKFMIWLDKLINQLKTHVDQVEMQEEEPDEKTVV